MGGIAACEVSPSKLGDGPTGRTPMTEGPLELIERALSVR